MHERDYIPCKIKDTETNIFKKFIFLNDAVNSDEIELDYHPSHNDLGNIFETNNFYVNNIFENEDINQLLKLYYEKINQNNTNFDAEKEIFTLLQLFKNFQTDRVKDLQNFGQKN